MHDTPSEMNELTIVHGPFTVRSCRMRLLQRPPRPRQLHFFGVFFASWIWVLHGLPKDSKWPRCEPWCWNIYLHFLAILGGNVGKYEKYMEHLGDGKWIVVNDYSTLNDRLCRKVGNLERCIRYHRTNHLETRFLVFGVAVDNSKCRFATDMMIKRRIWWEYHGDTKGDMNWILSPTLWHLCVSANELYSYTPKTIVAAKVIVIQLM